VRKPGAFENYQFRDELFPTSRFRVAWDVLREVTPARANKRYLEILQLAAREGEVRVDHALRCLLERHEIDESTVDAAAVLGLLSNEDKLPDATCVEVAEVSLASFDELLGSVSGVIQ
jgi:hypothetical protein